VPPLRLQFVAAERQRGVRLDQALAEWLPAALGRPVSKGQARKLVVAGAVYLNGRRVRIASKTLLPGARLEVHVDLARLEAPEGPRRDRAFTLGPEHILYEQDGLLAVNKPAGLPTQPTLDEARQNLYATLQRYVAARAGKAVNDPEAYVGLHHRLDRDTSGVVLFTTSRAANAGVARLFAERLASKTYHCLARWDGRAVDAEWKVRDYLGRDPGKKGRMRSVRSGGDPAETDFRVLERLPGALLIEARPRTGRMHQIRVHLSEAGLPILGDATYGDESTRAAAPRLMLHAANLTFPHPVHNVEVSISAPIPEDFQRCLQQLKSGKGGEKAAD
jgi:RluA family pseudouridine synthase